MFHSFSVDFEFEVLIEPDEPDVPIAAEDCHERQVPGIFESSLKVLIGARGMRGIGTLPWVAMEVPEEFVPELFEPDQQIVGRGHVGHDAQPAPALVHKLRSLVEDVHALDLGARDEKGLDPERTEKLDALRKKGFRLTDHDYRLVLARLGEL